MDLLGRLQIKSTEIYTCLAEDLRSLQRSSPETLLQVRLAIRDVHVDGFWARVYEDVVTGLTYSILETHPSSSLLTRVFPLHTAPWRYHTARLEGAFIADAVARKTAREFASEGVLATPFGLEAQDGRHYISTQPFAFGSSLEKKQRVTVVFENPTTFLPLSL